MTILHTQNIILDKGLCLEQKWKTECLQANYMKASGNTRQYRLGYIEVYRKNGFVQKVLFICVRKYNAHRQEFYVLRAKSRADLDFL